MSHDNDHHHPEPEAPAALRARAIESLLIEKGLLSGELVDSIVRVFEQDYGPMNCAKVVARAWVDRDYRARLLRDGAAAITELGLDGSRFPLWSRQAT